MNTGVKSLRAFSCNLDQLYRERCASFWKVAWRNGVETTSVGFLLLCRIDGSPYEGVVYEQIRSYEWIGFV